MVSRSRVAAGNKKHQSSDKIKTLYSALCQGQLGPPPHCCQNHQAHKLQYVQKLNCSNDGHLGIDIGST